MPASYDVVVVGAGISGASTAYFLKQKGAGRVLLLESGSSPACSNTGKSAAIVRTFYTLPVMARIAKTAVDLFASLPDELGRGGGFQQTGFTQLLPPAWVDIATEIVSMHRALGIETEVVDPSDYGRRFPWLNAEGVGAIVFEPGSGYADPVATTRAYVEGFHRLGGEVRFETPCRRLRRQADRIVGVELEDGAIDAGTVVNAAGPWARHLAEFAEVDLPLRAVREQDTIWEVADESVMPSTPVSNAVEAAYMRPTGPRRWLLGRGYPKPYTEVDPHNFKRTPDDDETADIFARLVTRIPVLSGTTLVDGYAALYDVTPDWMPFVGPRAGLDGYVDLCGGSGHLFKTAPAIARELADWMLTGTVADDFRQLSYDRVPAQDLFQQRFGGNRA